MTGRKWQIVKWSKADESRELEVLHTLGRISMELISENAGTERGRTGYGKRKRLENI